MKNTILIIICLLSISVFAQTDSTKISSLDAVFTESVKGISMNSAIKWYDWTYKPILKSPPSIEPQGEQTVYVVRLTKLPTKEILEDLEEKGFIPAPAGYVLALGLKRPDILEKCGSIVALGDKVMIEDMSYIFISQYHEQKIIMATSINAPWDKTWYTVVIKK